MPFAKSKFKSSDCTCLRDGSSQPHLQRGGDTAQPLKQCSELRVGENLLMGAVWHWLGQRGENWRDLKTPFTGAEVFSLWQCLLYCAKLAMHTLSLFRQFDTSVTSSVTSSTLSARAQRDATESLYDGSRQGLSVVSGEILVQTFRKAGQPFCVTLRFAQA